jgi:hypothetical protein
MPTATSTHTPTATATGTPLGITSCKNFDLKPTIKAIDQRAKHQEQIIRGTAKFMRDNKVFTNSETDALLAETRKIYTTTWVDVWKIPNTVLDCPASAGCQSVGLSAQLKQFLTFADAFNKNAKKLSIMVRGKFLGMDKKIGFKYLDRASDTVRKIRALHEMTVKEIGQFPTQTFSCAANESPIRTMKEK